MSVGKFRARAPAPRRGAQVVRCARVHGFLGIALAAEVGRSGPAAMRRPATLSLSKDSQTPSQAAAVRRDAPLPAVAARQEGPGVHGQDSSRLTPAARPARRWRGRPGR